MEMNDIKLKKRIAVDMDGVLADVYEQFFRLDEIKTGTRKTLESVTGVLELEAFQFGRDHVLSDDFFRTAPVMKDSQQILEQLHQQYEVFIVSSATEFPKSLSEKQAWLGEHFPFISWKQMVFCGSKAIIQADIMIDDHFKNLDYFTGQTILFSQPHNALADAGKHRRVSTWKEIEKLLL
ncbi:MAG: 5 nucleotidase, deoxy, cytosolic type [Cytophagaceae bacterium]|jgi:5'(3')-deoxyribonucleotidase|nr:5 nucleotidase, deoxy, cytosolic type [Cytophagaceae bacterium]